MGDLKGMIEHLILPVAINHYLIRQLFSIAA